MVVREEGILGRGGGKDGGMREEGRPGGRGALHGFFFDGRCGFDEEGFGGGHFVEDDIGDGGFAAPVVRS